MPSKLTEKQVNKYIEGIHNGSITEYDLPTDVYDSIVSYLKSGLYKGFGQTMEEAEGADLELLSQLRENVYMFGAAKTYQMTKEISSLLVGDDGEVRTAKEFNDIARDTYDNWNDNWGETEYQTAIGQAKSASKWAKIEEQKDTLPNLRYSAILDDNTSEICAPLNGLVAPVDDPIWNTVGPLNHFNCRCVLLQEDAEIDLTPDGDKDDRVDQVENEMSDVFKSNPGKDGEIFNKDHPYFDVPKKDVKFAKSNFGLPIPPSDYAGETQVLQKTMLEEEEEAVKAYTQTSYGNINNYLRGGETGEGAYTNEMKRLVDKIDNFLTKADKFEGTTWRGLEFNKKDHGYKELIKAIKGNGELFDKAFMSTSSDEYALKDFLNNPGKEHIVFEIEGKSGVDISHLSNAPGEKEVMFPRNTKFKVVSYEEKDYGPGIPKHYNVKLKEL